MSAVHDIDRTLAAWIHAEAPAAAPGSLVDQIDSAVERTARRPRWLLAVTNVTDWPRVTVPSTDRVQIAVVIAVVAGIVGLLLVGSRPTVPPPYGPARSGMYVLSLDGDLAAIGADGTDRSTLTSDDAWDSNPSFSRDGTSIAFWSLPAGSRTAELAVMSADITARRTVATTTLRGTDSGPRMTWSPDGSRLAFSEGDEAGSRIRVVRADGSGELQIGAGAQSASDPSWSPDGSRIAFRSGPDAAHPGVYLTRADGTDPTLLLAAEDVDSTTPIAWAPDGGRLAVSTCDATCRLHTVGVDGTDDRVIDTSAVAVGASWSPDGRRLAWLRVPAGETAGEYVIANADGSDPVVFPHPAAPIHGGLYDGLAPIVQWTPDGRRVTAVLGSGDGWTFDRLLMIETADGHVTVIETPGVRSWDQQRLTP